jgi:hypothetical protein
MIIHSSYTYKYDLEQENEYSNKIKINGINCNNVSFIVTIQLIFLASSQPKQAAKT